MPSVPCSSYWDGLWDSYTADICRVLLSEFVHKNMQHLCVVPIMIINPDRLKNSGYRPLLAKASVTFRNCTIFLVRLNSHYQTQFSVIIKTLLSKWWERWVTKWFGRPRFNPKLSHTKDSKMVLDAALLNTQHYKMIKGKLVQSRERSSALPYTSV